MTTTTTTFTLCFNPTTEQRTTWLDYSRDSYEIDFETTYEVEQTFATFAEALKAARALCCEGSVCCRPVAGGPIEFFEDADAREDALAQREQFGCQNNHIACIVENKVTAPVAEADWVCPF